MLRDSRVRFPWFDGRVVALRRVDLPLDSQLLHEQTFEVLKQPHGWHHLIHSALTDAAEPRLPALQGCRLLLRTGSAHPFAAFDTGFLALRPDAGTLADSAPRGSVEAWLLESLT